MRATSSETIIGWRERVQSVTDDIAYPSVDLILGLHKQIVEEGDAMEPGVRSEDAIASALQYISERFFGLNTSGSAFYLAAWHGDDPEVIQDRLGQISSTAQEIIDVVSEVPDDE